MEMIKIRKKPIMVDGIELTQKMLDDDFMFSLHKRSIYVETFGMDNKRFIIETLEGDMRAKVGDWLIVGVEGEMYPCEDKIFEKTYDIVEPMNLTPRIHEEES